MFTQFNLDYIIDIEVAKGKTQAVDDIKKCLQQDYSNNVWIMDLNRVPAKRGHGFNELRTYTFFKLNFKTEHHVKNRCISY